MSRSGSGKPDTDLEGVELLFHQRGGSVIFGAKMMLSLNGVDPGCMNPITGSICRAKCAYILHDSYNTQHYEAPVYRHYAECRYIESRKTECR